MGFREQSDERVYTAVGEEHWNDNQRRKEIYTGELCDGGMGDPIIVHIYATRYLGHGGCVHGSGEDTLGNLFTSSFLQKDKNPPTLCKRSK